MALVSMLLGTGALAVVLVNGREARRCAASTRSATAAVAPADRAPLASTGRAHDLREPVELFPDGDVVRAALGSGVRSTTPPTGERELREAFVRRERAEPGTLDQEAAALLASDSASPEKVALLRALEDVHSPQLDVWLEQAVRVAPDVASPRGVSVASFALERLARRAARRPEARQALLRLAFDERSSAPAATTDERRQAAAAVAAACPLNELGALEAALRRERDDELVRRVLLALRPRRAEPPVRRLLDLFGTNADEPAEPGAGPTVE